MYLLCREGIVFVFYANVLTLTADMARRELPEWSFHRNNNKTVLGIYLDTSAKGVEIYQHPHQLRRCY